MRMEDGLDSILFHAYYLEGKSEEELQKLHDYLKKKIKIWEREVKLKWKYDSHQRAIRLTNLSRYRLYLFCTEVELDKMRGENTQKSGELQPLIDILKSRQKQKPREEKDISPEEWENIDETI